MALTNKTLNKLIVGLVILTILFQVGAELIPTGQSAGDELTDEGQCNAEDSCTFNSTASATEPCRSSTNHSNVCPAGQPSVPLGGLFGGSSVVFVIVMAFILVLVVRAYLKDTK